MRISDWSSDVCSSDLDGLGFETDREYQSIGRIGGQWDWRIGGRDSNSYLNVAPYNGQALRENSGLRVLVAQGYYDFARSDERRVGKEWGGSCRSGWLPYH